MEQKRLSRNPTKPTSVLEGFPSVSFPGYQKKYPVPLNPICQTFWVPLCSAAHSGHCVQLVSSGSMASAAPGSIILLIQLDALLRFPIFTCAMECMHLYFGIYIIIVYFPEYKSVKYLMARTIVFFFAFPIPRKALVHHRI